MIEGGVIEDCRSQIDLFGLQVGDTSIVVFGEMVNLGSSTWSSQLVGEGLLLGAQVISIAGKIVVEARAELPFAGIAAGEKCPFLFEISLQDVERGTYTVSVGVLRESRYWFYQHGGGRAETGFEYPRGAESGTKKNVEEGPAIPRKLLGVLLSGGESYAAHSVESLRRQEGICEVVLITVTDGTRKINEALRAYPEHDVVFLDDSLSTPDSPWLVLLQSALSVDGKIGAVGGVVVSKTGRVVDAGGDLAYSGYPHYWGCGALQQSADTVESVEVVFASYLVVLLGRPALAAVGDFSEGYSSFEFAFMEWSVRARERGFRSIVIPRCRVSADECGITKRFESRRVHHMDRQRLLSAFTLDGLEVHEY